MFIRTHCKANGCPRIGVRVETTTHRISLCRPFTQIIPEIRFNSLILMHLLHSALRVSLSFMSGRLVAGRAPHRLCRTNNTIGNRSYLSLDTPPLVAVPRYLLYYILLPIFTRYAQVLKTCSELRHDLFGLYIQSRWRSGLWVAL